MPSEHSAGTAVTVSIALGRIAFGAAMFLTPRRTLAALHNPLEQISGTALLMTRLYGVRDVALGGATVAARADRERLRGLCALNAAVDGGDATAMLIGLVRREGSDRALLEGAALASSVSLASLWAYRGLA